MIRWASFSRSPRSRTPRLGQSFSSAYLSMRFSWTPLRSWPFPRSRSLSISHDCPSIRSPWKTTACDQRLGLASSSNPLCPSRMARSTGELPPRRPTQPGFAYFFRNSRLLRSFRRWILFSGIGSPDPEVLEVFGGLPVGNRDVRHARLLRPAIAPGDQLLHLLLRPLGHRLDPAVGKIPHPARHPDPLGRPLAGPAISHPLDHAGDPQVRADHQSFRKTPTTTPWTSTRSTMIGDISALAGCSRILPFSR